jgi:arylsulfatase A-like enzyme
MTIRDEMLLTWPRDPKKVREMIAEYYRYISYLDQQIGRVLDTLAASPYGKNTIIVFAADSGVARGQHGLIGKQNCYEHSMRVPLIIAGPGIPAGVRTKAMCYLFDVLPTLGKLCQVPGPKTSEGIDLSATITDPGHAGRPHIVLAYKSVQRAIRDERWKLIRYPQINRTQLFDLKTDPAEIMNLAEKPEHAVRVQNMQTVMADELKKFGDTAPLTVEKPSPAEWAPPQQKKE